MRAHKLCMECGIKKPKTRRSFYCVKCAKNRRKEQVRLAVARHRRMHYG